MTQKNRVVQAILNIALQLGIGSNAGSEELASNKESRHTTYSENSLMMYDNSIKSSIR